MSDSATLKNPMEYLDAELAAEGKHEYVKGKLIPIFTKP